MCDEETNANSEAVGLVSNKRTKEVSVRAWRGICRSPINRRFGSSRVGAKAYRGEAIRKRVVRRGISYQFDPWRTLLAGAWLFEGLCTLMKSFG